MTVNANGHGAEHKAHASREPAAMLARSRACLVVPAYDAEKTVGAVIHELASEMPEVAAQRGGIIVVDDGSSDATARIASSAGAFVVGHGKNRGKGAALATGLGTADALGFDVVVTVDADLQHPADSARAVLEASRDRPRALVLGIRDMAAAGAPKLNRFSNGVSNFFLSKLTGNKLRDTQCGLRRYPVRETLALAAYSDGYAFEAEIIMRAIAAGLPVVQIPVGVRYGETRVTHFDSVKDPARIVAIVLRTLREIHRG